MRTIRIIEHISLDGIIQAPGGPREDGDYPYGGWIVPYSDPVIGEAILTAQGERFDLLLGRRTYDIWAGYWPSVREGRIAGGFNAATKFVVTHRPESLQWGPVEPVGADVVAGVGRIRATTGPDIIVWGSSTLTPALLGRGLVDEVVLITYPVLLGTGKRFFSGAVEPRALTLVGTRAGASGVMVNTYRPDGTLRTGSFHKPAL